MSGNGGTLRGKRGRYTLILVPLKVQPSPALQRSLDLRIDLSPFLEVTKAQHKRPAGSSAVTAAIDRAADTVTWANIGDARSKKAMPQKLTFTIVATLASDTPKGVDIKGRRTWSTTRAMCARCRGRRRRSLCAILLG